MKPQGPNASESTLRDHYHSADTGGIGGSFFCDSASLIDNSKRMDRVDELLRSVHKHCRGVPEERNGVERMSPSPARMQTKTRSTRSTSRSDPQSRSGDEKGRSPSPGNHLQGGPPARPGWNRRTPVPRAKPVVSDPRTEPRRITRSSSSEDHNHLRQERFRGSNSARPALSAPKAVNKISTVTVVSSRAQPSQRPKPNASEPSVVVVLPQRKQGSSVLDGKRAEELLTDDPRFNFIHASLQEAQERATRAEARCEELEVTVHTLQLQHNESTRRLEERQAQLNAQVQYLLQWVRQLEGAAVKGEVVLGGIREAEGSDPLPGTQCGYKGREDTFVPSCGTDNATGAGLLRQEVGPRSTSLRVPPNPPICLKLQSG
uniref:Uncharacterized protein TCIL3000_2_1160 n=1 Tax=Trypanosoma congolense (strain IL3000) TaxID=1068625 RepID=G0UJI5_TRYCI|nr:unnamed protein product [Trypanosoma congolense IL3000]